MQIVSAFTPPARMPGIFCTVPCFDEPTSDRGQMRLALMLPVHLPPEPNDFLKRLLARSGKPILARSGLPFTEPFVVQLRAPSPIEEPAPIPAPAPSPQATKKSGPNVVTPLMTTVEAIVRRHAVSRQPMPTNPILGTLAGDKGRNVVARALVRMHGLGRIQIELKDGMRRVVLPNGSATDWGKFVVTPHKPYSRRARGEAPAETPVRVDYKPVEGEQFRYRVQAHALVPTKPARVCQYPMWDDDVRPYRLSCDAGDTQFCGQPSNSGMSWCEAHRLVVFEGARPPVARMPDRSRNLYCAKGPIMSPTHSMDWLEKGSVASEDVGGKLHMATLPNDWDAEPARALVTSDR